VHHNHKDVLLLRPFGQWIISSITIDLMLGCSFSN